MKKILFTLLLFIFCITPVCAQNNIYSIDMDIYLDEMGNARIKEVWDVLGSDGTEWYKGYGNVGNMKVSNFKVSMDGQPLTYKKWNVNESLSAKKGYYGIVNKAKGYELCFGKYDFKRHVFTLEYTLSNVIFNTSDAQVLYNTFIDRLTNVNFQNFSIEISSYYEFPNTLDVWGFGYKGYAYVENGKIKMANKGTMGSQYAVLLAKFPDNTFKTNNKYSQFSTFDTVLTKAQEGSYKHDYSSSSNNSQFRSIDVMLVVILVSIVSLLLGLVCKFINLKLKSKAIFIYWLVFFLPAVIVSPIMILPVIFLGYVIYRINNREYYGYMDNKKIKEKQVPYFRDIPCHDIHYANALLYLNGWNQKKENIIGAIYLKWIHNHLMEVEKDERGKLKLLLKHDVELNNPIEQELYKMLVRASEDYVLEAKELERWAKKNYTSYLLIIRRFVNLEINRLKDEGKIKFSENKTECKYPQVMDDTIYEDSIKLYGLKKFLLHFSRIKDREAIDVHLWEEYLLFAYLFGIAKKVSKQFKKLYPELEQVMQQTMGIDFDTLVWINHMSTRSISVANSARRAEEARESAASSYSSGGGGYSSGGGGGGSFGGGGGGGSR